MDNINKYNSKMVLLGEAPIPKALMVLGLPTMIGMMINALYNLVDAYFVGGLGKSQMGAISVVFPLGQLIVGLGLLFGNGAASYISRLLGRKDIQMADKTASTALYCSLMAGIVFIAVSLVFMNPILKLLSATDSILPYARIYALIYISSSILNIFNVTMNNIITSEGNAKTTMLALMTGAVLNIVLDPLFIFTFRLGIAGAAIATAISQLSSTFVYLIYVFRKKSVFHFRLSSFTPSKEIMSEILKIGIPTFAFQLLTSLSITLINMQAEIYGDSAIAGMGAVTRVISMGSLMVFGFIKGFQPIAGFSYGAGKTGRLNLAIRTAIIWSTIFCVLYGLISAVFSHQIISSFSKDDTDMMRIGSQALITNGLSFCLFGFHTVYSSLFLALGKAKDGCILGACRQGICFIPVILILPILLGMQGIIAAQPVADILSAVITVIMALRLNT